MHSADRTLLFITGTLVLAGLLIISSASIVISNRNYGTLYAYTIRHAFYAIVLGGLALFYCQKIPYTFWKKVSLPLLLFSIVLMMLVFFPVVGIVHGGARRWLDLGFVSFQPSELLKLTLIIYLSSWLDKSKSTVKTIMNTFVPFIVILVIVGVFLAMQPDIGTLLVIGLTACALYFLGGGTVSQLFSIAIMSVCAMLLLIQIFPYQADRLTVFLNQEKDPTGIGYQMKQAFIAIGSGGFFGKGFGQGYQKYNFLPEPINDSIFAIMTEELGFLSVATVIALFLFFAWRGMLIAKHAPTFYGKLLAAGITSSIVIQATVNMAAISGLLPLTGIPLPFISYGGTSIILTLASVGILLNISKNSV